MFGRDFWRTEVESGDLLGHFVDVLSGQFTVGLQGAEQAGLRELAHLQHILDHRAVAAQLRRFDAAGHRQHVQIQIFGQALIQTQFFSAEVLARFEAGEVEKAEIHRLLHFISKRPGEDHPRDMGFDDLEPVDGVRVEGRVLQGSDQ